VAQTFKPRQDRLVRSGGRQSGHDQVVHSLCERDVDVDLGETEEATIDSHHPSIVGIHNLRSRMVGHSVFLDFQIEIRGEADFKKAHEMTESLIDKIKTDHPSADVTVHFDPEGE
jgi:divalent metal cation (Fe/Co/Zn/Cd) transporter